MASLNKVLLMGNLTRSIELRYTPRGTAVADLSLAINRSWRDEGGNKQEEVTFIDVTLWGKTAELAHKYLVKGSGLFIEGRLQLESWEDKDTGKKRSRIKVIGENIQFLPSSVRGGSATATQPPPASVPSSHSNIPDDDDIPF